MYACMYLSLSLYIYIYIYMRGLQLEVLGFCQVVQATFLYITCLVRTSNIFNIHVLMYKYTLYNIFCWVVQVTFLIYMFSTTHSVNQHLLVREPLTLSRNRKASQQQSQNPESISF